jgi:hypothetical protein
VSSSRINGRRHGKEKIMHRDHIVVGNAYVNEQACIVREIIEEVDERRVRFNAFELPTGRLVPTRHHVCEKSQFAQWADREASATERAILHPYGQEQSHAQADGATHGRQDVAAARAMIESSPGHHTFPQVK